MVNITSQLPYLAPYTSSSFRFDLTQITGHSAQTVVDVLEEREDWIKYMNNCMNTRDIVYDIH